MASMGSLVVDLQANTRQFDQAIQRSRETMTAFAEGTRTAATAAGTLNNLTIGTDTARQLQMATKQMGDLQTHTQSAAEQVARFEHVAHLAAAGVSVATKSVQAMTATTSTVGAAAATASHGMHLVVVGAIAVRRTLQALAWTFGVIADGARVLIAPFKLLADAAKILLYPFKLFGGLLASVARGFIGMLAPVLKLAGGVLSVWVQIKAFQLQLKLMRAILDMLPPKVKVVAGVLFGLGLASRTAGFALDKLGAAGRMLGGVLRTLAAPLRAVLSPMQTLERAAKSAGGAIKGFIGSALTPMKLALSGLGAVAGAGAILKLAADAETLQLQMEVLTKDAGVAAKLVKDLNAFSATVPFNKMDLKQAATQLLAVQTPVSEIISDLAVLSNLAAGSGNAITDLTDIFAKLRSQGAVGMGEINQLQERGINLVPILTGKFGDLQKAAEANAISFHDIRAALYQLTTAGGAFAGMTERLSKGLAGQFNTLKNNVLIAATAIGEMMRPAITKALAKVNELVAMFSAVEDKITFIGQILKDVFKLGIEYLRYGLSNLFDWMERELMRRMAGGFWSKLIGKAFGFDVQAEIAKAQGNRQPVSTVGIEVAKLNLLGTLAQHLKPLAQQPGLGINPEIIAQGPAAKAEAGRKLAAAIGGFVERLKGNAQPVMQALATAVEGKLLAGAQLVNAFSGMFGGAGGETARQQEQRTAAAMQRGSADAYSTIVQAMMGRGDAQVQATKQQTKELKEPLVDMVGLLEGIQQAKVFLGFGG